MSNDAEPCVPSYRDLIEELEDSTCYWTSMSNKLDQLHALLVSIRAAVAAGGGGSIGALAELGMDLTDQTSNLAQEKHGSERTMCERALSAIPKRSWRKCGYPCEPCADELAEEQMFARAIADFPKDGWDEDATLVCLIQAKEGEAA